MRTPQTLLTPLGTRYPAISIPGEQQARGIIIDNPSGAWLHLRPTDDFIPPYTMGWSRPLPGVVSVDISYESPAGQVSTLQGDIPTVVLDTETVAADAGSRSGTPFIEQFTPVLTVNTQGTVVSGGGFITTLVNGVSNKRIRLLTATVTGGNQGQPLDGGFTWVLNGTGFFVSGAIDTMRGLMMVPLVYPSGADLAVGSSLDFSASQQTWRAAIDVHISVSYQRI